MSNAFTPVLSLVGGMLCGTGWREQEAWIVIVGILCLVTSAFIMGYDIGKERAERRRRMMEAKRSFVEA